MSSTRPGGGESPDPPGWLRGRRRRRPRDQPGPRLGSPVDEPPLRGRGPLAGHDRLAGLRRRATLHAERFIRTLKEQRIWSRPWRTPEELASAGRALACPHTRWQDRVGSARLLSVYMAKRPLRWTSWSLSDNRLRRGSDPGSMDRRRRRLRPNSSARSAAKQPKHQGDRSRFGQPLLSCQRANATAVRRRPLSRCRRRHASLRSARPASGPTQRRTARGPRSGWGLPGLPARPEPAWSRRARSRSRPRRARSAVAPPDR